MNPHIHIHVVMTAGGLSLDQQTWVGMNLDDPALAAERLAGRFRDSYIAGLLKLYRRGLLTMPRELGWVECEEDFERWLQPLAAIAWQVRRTGPPPYARGPEPALKYLARYVVGSAINDSRLVSDDGRHVVIRIKNYHNNTEETKRLTGEEFVHASSSTCCPAT